MEEKKLLKKVFSCIDNTTLDGADTCERVKELCRRSVAMCDKEREIGRVASVCVYPVFIDVVRESLDGCGIKTACVVGGFPSGQVPLVVKECEASYAVEHGADEVDMVINRGALLEGRDEEVRGEIESLRSITKGLTLKVIIETGELQTEDNIRRASMIALNAGADFIKTSTGKSKIGATPAAAKVMIEAIKDYERQTGRLAGLKISGGVSTPDEALFYARMAYEIYGEEHFDKNHFRIGASRLVANLFNYLTE